jgi:hypothetical protein
MWTWAVGIRTSSDPGAGGSSRWRGVDNPTRYRWIQSWEWLSCLSRSPRSPASPNANTASPQASEYHPADRRGARARPAIRARHNPDRPPRRHASPDQPGPHARLPHSFPRRGRVRGSAPSSPPSRSAAGEPGATGPSPPGRLLAPKLRRRDCASTCGFVVRACSFCCLDRAELLGKLRDVLSRRGPETFDVKAVVFVNNDVCVGR